jgi:hypothetical protein
MASREHSGVRASLPPVDADEAGAETSRAAVTSDGFGWPHASRATGRPAATPRTANGCHSAASLCEGALAFTRRAVLGAAVAVPVAAGVGPSSLARASSTDLPSPRPSPLQEEEEVWDVALVAYREADAARARFEVETSAASAGPEGRSFEEQEGLDDEYGLFVSAADSAMLRLLEAPAPDLEALVVKICLISAHLVWESDGGEDCLAWLEADARRLAERQ